MTGVGNYVLGARIGRGATGEVFAAQHRFSGAAVALKVLYAGAGGEAAEAELAAEADALRAVRHPSVVSVLDFGRDDATGRCYLAMERIDGESLADRLRREAALDAGLGEEVVRQLGAEIADGLAAVHAAGIVHRDLKPANVMLDGGRAKLVDFGIAKHLGAAQALVTSRQIGTVAYMAPEQLAGGLISPAVDVWALGVVLFEAATGRLPFDGFAGGRLPQLVEAAPRASSVAAVSPALDRVIASCLEREPGRRPPSMAAVARALRGDGEDEERFTVDAGPIAPALPPIPPPPPALIAAGPRAVPPAVRAPVRRRWAIGAGVLGVAAIAAAGLAVSGGAPAPVQPEVAAGSAGSAESVATAGSATRAEAAQPEPALPESGPKLPEPEPKQQPDPQQSQPQPSGATTAPRRATLSVHVRSTPSGAQIFLGDRLLGTTPRRLDLPAAATLTLRYRGYQPARVRAARAGPLDVRLARACAHPPCEDLN